MRVPEELLPFAVVRRTEDGSLVVEPASDAEPAPAANEAGGRNRAARDLAPDGRASRQRP